MEVNGVPLDAVADEVVVMGALVVVNAIQVGLEAALKPPGPVVMLGAVVIEAVVVVVVVGTEGLAVVTLPV